MALVKEKEFIEFALNASLNDLMQQAALLRDEGHGALISYSKKVFIPLTQLCRDVCHYCTFAKIPKHLPALYLSTEDVLNIAKAGAEAGCHEALFTLGDKPELRYPEARRALDVLGFDSTISYLEAMCHLVLKETTLLPHVNPGVLTASDLTRLRKCSISQGIMLENVSPRLCMRGAVHYGSPDKNPLVRLQTIEEAGRQKIPFTTGILIGIGETREERIQSLLSLHGLHLEYGHLQEIIIQNFRAKPQTKMANAAEPELDDLLWTIAIARILFGTEMNIQAPPNLSPNVYPRLIQAGLNDWGGISPVTKDHVNPEAPWPEIEALAEATRLSGKTLIQRLASYPRYCQEAFQWHDKKLASRIIKLSDSQGFFRNDLWSAGQVQIMPPKLINFGLNPPPNPSVQGAIENILEGKTAWNEQLIVRLFQAQDDDLAYICNAADSLRQITNGDVVRYVVNRNINYTNICYFKCQFCAFSKGKKSASSNTPPYLLTLDEIVLRTEEAWTKGATEVCLQGGIHPEYTGNTYIEICKAIRQALPKIHIHAFSPLEVWQGAVTLNKNLKEYLLQLQNAGLNTLPGTAAEILDDSVRRHLCPDKIRSNEWLVVMRTAHQLGIKTTATIMFGHMEQPIHWARHLLKIRNLQIETGGFTEFVPLPYVHMASPLYLRGYARKGPTFREALLMHAVSRLVLHPVLSNIQVSWVKLGEAGVKQCLNAGANDLGGTLMNESISRAAGTLHGQEMAPEKMDALIQSINRRPEQRTSLYSTPESARIKASYLKQNCHNQSIIIE